MFATAVYLVILTFRPSYCDDPNHQMCATTEAGKNGDTMPKPVRRGKIVGEKMKATYAPFQVRLVYFDVEAKQEVGPICGGTIISQRFVLTASHCVARPLEEFALVVVFGSLNWCPVMETVKENPKGPWKNAVLAEKLYIHPDWDPKKGPLKNDIAIIKVGWNRHFFLQIGDTLCSDTLFLFSCPRSLILKKEKSSLHAYPQGQGSYC